MEPVATENLNNFRNKSENFQEEKYEEIQKSWKKSNASQWRERGRGVEPVAEIPDWMVIRLSDGSQERGN